MTCRPDSFYSFLAATFSALCENSYAFCAHLGIAFSCLLASACSLFVHTVDKSTLTQFVGIHFIALSVGYPLMFSALGRISDQKSRQLLERVEQEWALRWLGWTAFVGALWTGFTVLCIDDSNRGLLFSIASHLSVFFFFATTVLFFIGLRKIFQYAFRPWEIALNLQFRGFSAAKKKSRVIGFARKPDLSRVVARWRKSLMLIAEQVRALSTHYGYEKELSDLLKRISAGLSPELLYELEQEDTGSSGEFDIEREFATARATTSLITDALHSLHLAHKEALASENQKVCDLIQGLHEDLVFAYTRDTGVDERCVETSRHALWLVLRAVGHLVHEAIRRDRLTDIKTPIAIYNNTLFFRYEISFDLRMLPEMDSYLLQIGRDISEASSGDSERLWSEFVGYLHEGPRFHPSTAAHPDTLFESRDTSTMDMLSRELECLYSREELKRFERLVDSSLSDISGEVDYNEKRVKLIEAAKGWAKLNHLRESLFSLGAWCLMEKKYEFIQFLWEYHQPPDATATYSENALFPRDVLSTLRHFVLVRRPHERDHDFYWKNHQGKGGWFRQYVLLHLLAAMEGKFEARTWNHAQSAEDVASALITGQNPAQIKAMEREVNELFEALDRVGEEALKALVLEDNPSAGSREKLKAILVEICGCLNKTLAKKKTASVLDKELLGNFETRVAEGFNSAFQLRQISIAVRHEAKSDSVEIWESPVQYQKHWLLREVFIRDWYVDGSSLGPEYGWNLAYSLQHQVLDKMAQSAELVSYAQFQERISGQSQEFILLAGLEGLGYKSVWQREYHIVRDDMDSRWADVSSYRGWFKAKGCTVYAHSLNANYPMPFPRSSVLIIPANAFGSIDIVGEDPKTSLGIAWRHTRSVEASEGEPWIGIGELTEEEIENAVRNPPMWLTALADEKDRDNSMRSWLKLRTIIWLRAAVKWTRTPKDAIYLVSGE